MRRRILDISPQPPRPRGHRVRRVGACRPPARAAPRRRVPLRLAAGLPCGPPLALSGPPPCIGQLELLAAATVYTSLPWLFVGAEVLHFVDNTSAVYGLVKGYSAQPDSAGVILAFHLCGLALRCGVWFNYVASKANVADLPSRGAVPEMVRALRPFDPGIARAERQVPVVLPVVSADLAAAWVAAEAVAAAAGCLSPRACRSRPAATAPPCARGHAAAALVVLGHQPRRSVISHPSPLL